MATNLSQEGRCRSCGAKIIWITTGEGKKIPLDARRHPIYEEISEGSGMIWQRVDDARVTHFATCPDANRWSKHGKKAGIHNPDVGTV